MRCITMDHQCGAFFKKEPDWSEPISWQDLMRGWVQLCCCVCWPACGSAFMCLCACAFTSLWRLHPLLTDSLRVLISHTPVKLWQRHFCTNTEWLLITTLCLWFMQNHATKRHESCLNKHTGPCGCRSMWDSKLLVFVAPLWITWTWCVNLSDTYLASGIV